MDDAPEGPPKRELSRQRAARAWELRLRGHTLAEIAAALEAGGLGRVSSQAIHKALRKAERRVLAGMEEAVKGELARQYAGLDHLYCESMQAWARSKGPAKLAREKSSADGAGAPARRETTHELRERTGDPRFLAEARAALADLRKLLGLDAPDKLLLGGLPPDPIAVRVRGLSDDQLAGLEAILGRNAGAPPGRDE